jgi:crotonobetainyl-CoA:carnitine CoA-transferase CaiB-like acyl-CoA transferase
VTLDRPGVEDEAPPLDGIRVLELCHFLAGPYAGLVLADLGADVLKVEDPTHPDDARSMGPHFHGDQSLYFLALNSGKRSIGVRLASPEGRAVVEDLARDADVVIDNYRPGVLAKFGLGHDALHAVNPALVTCSLTGYGGTGPDADRAGYDYTIQALAGVMSLAGEPDGPPTKAGISYVDHSGGITAALGVCAALIERARTGVGRHVDLGLFDVQISMLTYLASWQRNRGATFERTPNSAHQSLVPAQNFRTADGHLALFVGNDGMWRRFVDAVGDAEIADERFATREGRFEHRGAVIGAVQRVLLGATSREWEARLGDAGVACAAVNDVGGALTEPQVRARGLLVESEHPHYGRYEHLRGPLPTLGGATAAPAPLLGEHTTEALRAVGYDDSRIVALRDAGIVS